MPSKNCVKWSCLKLLYARREKNEGEEGVKDRCAFHSVHVVTVA